MMAKQRLKGATIHAQRAGSRSQYNESNMRSKETVVCCRTRRQSCNGDPAALEQWRVLVGSRKWECTVVDRCE